MLIFGVILFAFAWLGMTSDLSPGNFAEGIVLGLIVTILARPQSSTNHMVHKAVWAGRLLWFFIRQLALANVEMARVIIFQKKEDIQPGVVAIPLDTKTDVGIMILGNLITLTPGTLTLDVSDDKKVMYVHTLELEDIPTFRRSIKDGFERHVIEVFG